MADVTDAAFRRIIAKYSKNLDVEFPSDDLETRRPSRDGPDVMWTEFVSVDGLCSPGREVLLRDFLYTEAERPIVAQIFGSKPDNFYTVAKLIKKLGFDGIDINMGCPDKNVERQGGGAAMIKSPELAQKVIHAAQEGGDGLPVSVKTRVGFNRVELEAWIPKLLETKIAAVTVHARTRKEMSNVPARWGYVKEVVEIAKGSGTLVIGNGDVKDLDDARMKAAETGADGIMLGRAIFGNPWLFRGESLALPARPKSDVGGKGLSSEKTGSDLRIQPTLEEKLRVMVEHTKLFHELLGDIKNFAVMKKHFKAYVNGFDGAKELRMKLMETETPEEVEQIVARWLSGVRQH
ncbi:MAG: tRNA-dihydrouridine synthase [bacterium]|nr:tRNA-dihydrouridine synthase [bacterium]